MHISFSELKLWGECPYKHKLNYIDNIRSFKGNEHTAFGTALHSIAEELVVKNKTENEFDVYFLEELQKIPKDENKPLNKDLINDMRSQGKMLQKYIIPSLKDYFGKHTIFSVEEKLYELVDKDQPDQYNFKGFIDLVLETEDGKYHIIDWKTCSWGWDSRKKSDRMTTYQLTLYKHFFSIKHNINPEDIETHFALLKRTAKNNNVEIFRVTSGQKKTDNALKLLKKAIYNIQKGIHIKNRLACHGRFGKCDFFKTEHCT